MHRDSENDIQDHFADVNDIAFAQCNTNGAEWGNGGSTSTLRSRKANPSPLAAPVRITLSFLSRAQTMNSLFGKHRQLCKTPTTSLWVSHILKDILKMLRMCMGIGYESTL